MSTRNVTYNTTVPHPKHDDMELDIVVTFTYWPASRGYRDRYGAPEEPDEPAYLEFVEAADENGNEVELSDAQIDEITEKAMNNLEV